MTARLFASFARSSSFTSRGCCLNEGQCEVWSHECKHDCCYGCKHTVGSPFCHVDTSSSLKVGWLNVQLLSKQRTVVYETIDDEQLDVIVLTETPVIAEESTDAMTSSKLSPLVWLKRKLLCSKLTEMELYNSAMTYCHNIQSGLSNIATSKPL